MAGFKSATREALKQALVMNPETVRMSNYLLSEIFGIRYHAVQHLRSHLESAGLIPRVETRLCRDGSERDTSLIGVRG